MAETPSLPVIEEEEIGDDFYDKIEAPKFVDFTAPDTHPPKDDRYWFCLRVGCDQMHEEEMDYEAINKNFVLRVMAARSPNVRLKKALNRREASENLKCPLTAPAKSSKSRVSRLALISSMSQKMIDNSDKHKPYSKISATPNAKVKQSLAKALTTPRNPKPVSKLEQFRSVQNKKPMNVAVPKNRVVAKALVFHSPKKAVKLKSSIELKTPMKSLCSAMKKLELNNVKRNVEGNNKSLPVTAPRKQFRGREVKSRVFDSLYSNSREVQETSSTRCLKEKKRKIKDLEENQVPLPHNAAENYSSDMEIDEKSRAGSLTGFLESGASEAVNKVSLGAAESQEPTKRESSPEVSSDTSGGRHIKSLLISEEADNKTGEEYEHEEKSNPGQEKGPATKKRQDKENALASDDKENEGELTENDDKENVSATDRNKELNINHEHPKKTVLSSKHEDSRKTQKKSTSTETGPQAMKYRKPKPTNPKPFKFRTDERGILKEAILEKRHLSPLKETTAKGGKVIRKLRTMKQKNGTDDSHACEEKSDQATQEHQTGSIQGNSLVNSNDKVKRKLTSSTAHRRAGHILKKSIDLAKRLERRDKATKKSQRVQPKFVRPGGALSSEISSNILQPKEAEKPRSSGASPRSKATGASSRFCSRGRRATTIPKEPNFHSLHVPKSCTRKLI
ncbi:hypothetical protein L6164_032693 [Bauhinia variegata]|uniref:Uncharacterized protein n=1 Tax=Bauhinia variegata TaxID=167791 RepID=A0ACB9KPL3_BAUVA|nr:hypothetical protein L6164_032693 [Bauhinia variegata]